MIIKRNDQFLFGFVIIVLSLPKQTWPICSQSSQSKAVANNIYSAELGNELFKTKSMIEIIISFAGITQSALAFKINLLLLIVIRVFVFPMTTSSSSFHQTHPPLFLSESTSKTFPKCRIRISLSH